MNVRYEQNVLIILLLFFANVNFCYLFYKLQ